MRDRVTAMLGHSLWLWLMVWLAEAVWSPDHAAICDLDPCTCNRGKVQCDCSRSEIKEMVLEDWLLQDYLTTSISVANCNHVHVKSRALSGLPSLQQVNVIGVANLTLEEQAFSWTTDDYRHFGLSVDFSHCGIWEIPSYTFRGLLKDTVFTNVNITRTRPFAFSSINQGEKLQFTGVRFNDIAPQTFKKFSVNFLTFIDSYIDLLPTRTVVNVEVHKEVRLQNINVGRIESRALGLAGMQIFKLAKSTVKYIEHNAFLVHTKGDVSMNDNSFGYLERGVFLGITLDERYLRDAGKQDFVFENNTLKHAESAALTFNTTGFDVRLDWIHINQSCSCSSVDAWSNDLVLFHSNPITSRPEVNKITYCLDPKWSTIADYQKRTCEVSTYTAITKIGLTVTVILILLTIGAVVYYAIKKRGKRYINVPKHPPSSPKPADPNRSHILVVPDGKTYRETELHVIVEHLEPIVSTEYVKDRPD